MIYEVRVTAWFKPGWEEGKQTQTLLKKIGNTIIKFQYTKFYKDKSWIFEIISVS